MPSSAKIKSKDLSYENTLPPFLQRLHAQKAGLGDQDRHERPIARPKRVKTKDDEDDGPTVVDESGEMVSKEDVEMMTGTVENGDEQKAGASGDDVRISAAAAAAVLQEDSKVDQKVVDGMATKKRKVVKVVGDEDGAAEVVGENSTDSKSKKVKKKKKGKPIKLAFDDGDEP